MKHLFCSYELSLLAKEKGFDEGCFAIYYYGNKLKFAHTIYSNVPESVTNTNCAYIDLENLNKSFITAPLYSQLVDWFFYKGYYLHTYFISEANKFGCDVYDLKDQLKFSPFLDKKPLCVTKQEAIEQALFEAFKLI